MTESTSASKEETQQTQTKSKDTQLSAAKIRTIMKSSAEVGNITLEALHLVTKSAELFIAYLAKTAHKTGGSKSLDYKSLAKVVESEERFEFLKQIIPKKITVREFRKIMENEKDSGDSDSFSDCSSDSGNAEGNESSSSSVVEVPLTV